MKIRNIQQLNRTLLANKLLRITRIHETCLRSTKTSTVLYTLIHNSKLVHRNSLQHRYNYDNFNLERHFKRLHILETLFTTININYWIRNKLFHNSPMIGRVLCHRNWNRIHNEQTIEQTVSSTQQLYNNCRQRILTDVRMKEHSCSRTPSVSNWSE